MEILHFKFFILTIFSSRDDMERDVLQVVDMVELLFLAVASDSHQLKVCLHCVVRLCEHNSDLCSRFVELVGAQLLGEGNKSTMFLY